MEQTAKRKLRVADLYRMPGSQVFVRNRAVINNRQSEVNIPHNMNNRTLHVKIPITWVPVEVTEQLPKDELLKNPDFFRMVSRGWLELVDPADANALFDDSEPAREARDLINTSITLQRQNVDAALGTPGNPTVITEAQTSPAGQQQAQLAGLPPHLKQPAQGVMGNAEDVSINPTVLDVMNRPDGEMSEPARYSTIRAMLEDGLLRKIDLEYVMKQAKVDGNLHKLVADHLSSKKN